MAGRFFIAGAEENFAPHNEAGTLFARIAASFRAWAERQAVKAELENLDSRTLADLGIAAPPPGCRPTFPSDWHGRPSRDRASCCIAPTLTQQCCGRT